MISNTNICLLSGNKPSANIFAVPLGSPCIMGVKQTFLYIILIEYLLFLQYLMFNVNVFVFKYYQK